MLFLYLAVSPTELCNIGLQKTSFSLLKYPASSTGGQLLKENVYLQWSLFAEFQCKLVLL